jgi:hypothetical protein
MEKERGNRPDVPCENIVIAGFTPGWYMGRYEELVSDERRS